MNWCNFLNSLNSLRGRLAAAWSRLPYDPRRARLRRSDYFRKRCGVSKEEANRRTRDWIKDPGVLDDWNDTRSILDM